MPMLLLLLSHFSHVLPTLCNPRDGSPPGSAVPGILQARTLEWVAISFSNAWKWKVKVKLLSSAQLLATPWTAAYQAALSMGFSRQEYWSGVPLPSPDMCLYPLLIHEGRYYVSFIVGSVTYTRQYTFKRYCCPVPFSGREQRRAERRGQSKGDLSPSTEVHSSAWHVKSPSAGLQGPKVNKLMITQRESGGWGVRNKFGGWD